ncbi:MAG: DUF6868 family protein [Methylophagaceae bacterium]
MITLEMLTTFFGWCSIINIAILLLTTLLLMGFKDLVSSIHSKMFGIEPQGIPLIYFNYLGNYKIAIFIFSLVPYLALKIMG